MIKVKFRVIGKSWVLKVLDKKKYRKKNGRDSVAITKLHKRQIELSPDGIDLETVIHELVHAFLYELCVHSATLDEDNKEEIYAELMAKRGKELLGLADKLWLRLTTSL